MKTPTHGMRCEAVGAESVIAEARSCGVELRAAGDRLRFRPAEAVSPELREKLCTYKPEILRLLRPAVADALGGVHGARPSLLTAEVCAMRLDDFARAGLVIEVWSERLGEIVLFASDNTATDPGERRCIYRAAELRETLRFDAVSLRRVHQVKHLFRGIIRPA